jgi:hypothetical protein
MPKEPEKPPVPDTETGLMEAIVACCDALDIGMKKPRGRPMGLLRPTYYDKSAGWLMDIRDRMVELLEALDKLVPNERHDEDGDIKGLVQAALAVEPGIVPPWSRPGTFLCWAGFVPVRCIWGGFAFPEASMVPADPAMLWIPSGYMDGSIGADDITPDHTFRGELLRDMAATAWKKNKRVPTFKLEPLGAREKAQATEYLAANPWLRAALAKGPPANALPLPDHLAAVQLAL